MQRDYAGRSARYHADLLTPGEIGTQAGERAVARLNPGRLTSGPMPVVFDPRVGSSILGHLVGGIAGAAIARRNAILQSMVALGWAKPAEAAAAMRSAIVVQPPQRAK